MKWCLRRTALVALSLLCACDDSGLSGGGIADTGVAVGFDVSSDAADDATRQDFCSGPTEHRYDPLVGAALEMFPDDYLTREADTATGLMLDVTDETAPWLGETSSMVRSSLRDLSRLTGFGTSAPVLLRFSAPLGELPASAEASLESDSIRFLDLGVDPPERVPYEVRTADEGRDLILWPLRPLRPATRHAVLVTTSLQAADGACIRPSETTRALLTGEVSDARLVALVPRYEDVLLATGLAPEAVSAVTVFTTHDAFEVLIEVADDVATRDYDWDAAPDCEPFDRYRRCEGTFEALDYRDDRIIADAEPGDPWTLPVTIWLPVEGEGPYPTIISGHGLNSWRGMGSLIADRFAPRGFAVVGIDALRHGDHPTADPGDDLAALRFLGIDLQAARLDGLDLRGNFNQSLVDRLQLIELMRGAPDVDGDGAPDLDVGRLSYFGISLGGMMGPPLLALSDDIEASVLSVGGGRLMTFVTDNSQIEPFRPLITQMLGSESELDRLLVLLQTLVDGADPASFAPFVVNERLRGSSQAPHVLYYVALADETVPPTTGRALARALEIPHVGTIVQPVALIPRGAPLPVAGNLFDGGVTAGFFQYDRVSTRGGVEPASHTGTPLSPEADLQAIHFLTTWDDTGLPEIIDPYVELDTPPLN